MTYYTFYDTPAGRILLIGDGKTLYGLYWNIYKHIPAIQSNWAEDKSIFEDIIKQLHEYFAGERKAFDVTYTAIGTDFQMEVWAELETIPFGTNISYQYIANTIGRANAVRAVGTAVGHNPLSIIIPCHRVLTSNNKLGGYGGGLSCKQILLRGEGIRWKTS